ncbi:hypothetical protein N7G274_005894 [Stereocaulon virgatum]|uniref:Uncharacterized protein n=1 Tax=Stereocaulon virgatum TaxID=373712 RepID=A0ABR4A6I1_9LECA
MNPRLAMSLCTPKTLPLIPLTLRDRELTGTMNISHTYPSVTTTTQPCSGGHSGSRSGLDWSILVIMSQNGCVQISDSEELTPRAVEVQVLLARMGDVKKPWRGE